jgi:hypothetical protein
LASSGYSAWHFVQRFMAPHRAYPDRTIIYSATCDDAA